MVSEHLETDVITDVERHGQKPSSDLMVFDEKAEGVQGIDPGSLWYKEG